MSKELTEKYHNCLLEDGFYYAKSNDDNNTFIVEEYPWDDWKHQNCEILSAVPSYEEYQDIIQQNVNQESAIETYIERIKELEKKVHILNEANMKLENELGHFADIGKKVERLQEQLNEANKTIKKAQELCPDKNVMLMCNPARPSFGMMTNDVLTKYLEKWGVK